MNPKLESFKKLFGTVPDEKLAEMAGVSVEDVKAARDAMALDGQVTLEMQMERHPKLNDRLMELVDGEAAKLKAQFSQTIDDLHGEVVGLKATITEKDLLIEDLKARLAQVSAQAVVAQEKPEKPAETSPPVSVRVLKTITVRGPHSRNWTLNFRDVYGGEQASFLLKHYKELVEIYPAAKK